MFRLKRKALLGVLLVALAMVLAACGGNGDDGNGNGNGPGTGNGGSSGGGGGGSTSAGIVEILMGVNQDGRSAYEFLPSTVTIPPGTTVRWVNADPSNNLHNVIQGTVQELQAGTLDPLFASSELQDGIAVGETFEVVFNDVGVYEYMCTYGSHVFFGMTGTIIVEEGAPLP